MHKNNICKTRRPRFASPLFACCTALLVAAASSATAQTTETVLYSFMGGADGGNPEAGLVADSASNLYGMTEYGGASNRGTVFKVTSNGTETVLHSFTGGADGSYPTAGLITDTASNLYGTTPYGGTPGAGTVFKVTPGGAETVLYSFTSGVDGLAPYAGLVADNAGNLYGTTFYGVTGYGNVFKLTPSGTETILYSFTGGADGRYPSANLVIDSAGNLYGTTQNGGAFGYGTVYEVTPNGTETVLYSFTGGTDGYYPYAGLIADSAGNLYGTTPNGGTSGYGTVYKVTPNGTETVLYSFMGGTDGQYPYDIPGLVADSAGNLYGTTYEGGASGAGTVFMVTPNGTETVLYSFAGSPNDGATPFAGLIADGTGNLYGTTDNGGASGNGTVFELTGTGFVVSPNQVATPPGTGVSVTPVVTLPGSTTTNTVQILYSSVRAAGTTTVTAATTPGGGAPAAPSGFQLGTTPVYYDVTTSASFSGSVQLCFTWQEGQFVDDNNVQLFHYQNGAWVNVTTSVNAATQTVCGQVTSLSPFGLFEKSYQFSGFFPPVDNPPSLNTVKAGAAIPVIFSLNGDQGLAILYANYPVSQAMACSTGTPIDAITQTDTANASGLQYDASSNQYTYVWKTNKAWANSCRQLIVKLNDGSQHVANFSFH